MEMMAQAAGKCLMAGIERSLWPVLVAGDSRKLSQERHARIIVRIEATIESCNNRTATAQGHITCEGTRVADSSLTFGFIQKNLLRPVSRMKCCGSISRRRLPVDYECV